MAVRLEQTAVQEPDDINQQHQRASMIPHRVEQVRASCHGQRVPLQQDYAP
jgi:hypothetical protein